MGRSFTQPEVEVRSPGFVLTRVVDPDDEFAEHQVLCYDPEPAEFNYGFSWKPVGSSYDGSAVRFSTRFEAHQAVALMLFGRDSVSVGFSL